MQAENFHGACERCAALCCVMLAFDRSELFAFDKPAGVACPALTAQLRCAVYGRREQAGFSGCSGYDCYGAGQRVTEQVFGGRSWQSDPALLEPMADAFRVMRRVCELELLLHTARGLPLTDEQRLILGLLQQALTPAEGWSIERLARFEQGHVPGAVASFLSSLRDRVSAPRRHLPLATPQKRRA